ncbi:MAG: PEP-CTERM sorting domain-containing protein [Betaproteobacteria bacterium]|nr:PEP-CTERM sorting domain-containing protein [Betaproteobacteria bacterium]
MVKFAGKAVLAVALAGALSGAHAAAPTALGSVSAGTPLPFSGWADVGSFIQDFTFTLPANGGSGYSVVNFPLSIPGASFNTLFSTLALFSDPDGTPWNGDESLLTSKNSNGGPISMSWGPSAGGSMILQVSGATNGTAGGIFSGAISVSPVPEPATWATMATGAILLGFGLRKKRG